MGLEEQVEETPQGSKGDSGDLAGPKVSVRKGHEF